MNLPVNRDVHVSLVDNGALYRPTYLFISAHSQSKRPPSLVPTARLRTWSSSTREQAKKLASKFNISNRTWGRQHWSGELSLKWCWNGLLVASEASWEGERKRWIAEIVNILLQNKMLWFVCSDKLNRKLKSYFYNCIKTKIKYFLLNDLVFCPLGSQCSMYTSAVLFCF